MGNLTRPIQEVIDRLQYQAGLADPERILHGAIIRDIPIVTIESLKDFPSVSVFIPSIRETYRPKDLALPSISIPIVVSTEREKGLLHLYEWVERVIDALEVKRDGSGHVDPNLVATSKPFAVSVGNNFALELSLNAQLTITIDPRPVLRGTRRT